MSLPPYNFLLPPLHHKSNTTLQSRDAALNDVMVMSINVGCRVQGNYGPFQPAVCNPDGTQVKRKKQQLLEGVIVCEHTTHSALNGWEPRRTHRP
jgi:hypothetical protein